MAHRQCGDHLCYILGAFLLSGEFRGGLSPFGRPLAAVASLRSRRDFDRHHGGGRCCLQKVSVSFGRLALVFGNAVAGDRIDPSRRDRRGRSLYVSAANRHRDHADLGCSRSAAFLAAVPSDLRHRIGHDT